jgi:ABC-type glycerol-3-phosphate transport system permease component
MRLARGAFLVVLTVPYVYPFVFLVSVAIRTRDDYIRDPFGIPRDLTMAHLADAWNGAALGGAMVNSIVVSTLSAALLCVICALGAYYFLNHRGRAVRTLFYVIVGSWVVPLVIYVLPLFVALSSLGLTDNLVALAVVLAGLNAPFGLYLLDAYARAGMPAEIREAARVDGAGIWQEFRFVFLPLARPALGTLAALGFIWAWGDLLVSLLLIQSSELYPVTVAAATIGKSGFIGGPSGLPRSAAAALIAMLPLVAVFLVAQRAIMRGMTAGFTR